MKQRSIELANEVDDVSDTDVLEVTEIIELSDTNSAARLHRSNDNVQDRQFWKLDRLHRCETFGGSHLTPTMHLCV